MIKVFFVHSNLTADVKVKLSKMLVRILRYDYDKHGISLDRDGWFNIADIAAAAPLRHFQTSQVLERLAGEPQRFSIDGQRVRVHYDVSKAGRQNRTTRTGIPDLEGYEIQKHLKKEHPDSDKNGTITLITETKNHDTTMLTKLIQTDNYAEAFPTE